MNNQKALERISKGNIDVHFRTRLESFEIDEKNGEVNATVVVYIISPAETEIEFAKTPFTISTKELAAAAKVERLAGLKQIVREIISYDLADIIIEKVLGKDLHSFEKPKSDEKPKRRQRTNDKEQEHGLPSSASKYKSKSK